MTELNEILEALKTKFETRISVKICWGKNEIIDQFKGALEDVLIDALTDATDKLKNLGRIG